MELESAGRLLGACLVMAIVLYGLRAVVRGLGGAPARTASGGGRIVAVLETTVLPNATSLHVVRVAERYYLIGRGAQLTTLCEIAPESIAPAGGAAERPAHANGAIGRWAARLRASAIPGR